MLHTIKQRKGNWFGYILRMKCLLKHVIERKDIKDGKTRKKAQGATGSRQENEKIEIEFESGSTRSHTVGNWLWKGLWQRRDDVTA